MHTYICIIIYNKELFINSYLLGQILKKSEIKKYCFDSMEFLEQCSNAFKMTTGLFNKHCLDIMIEYIVQLILYVYISIYMYILWKIILSFS